jgi:short-subunit dehydrogenase
MAANMARRKLEQGVALITGASSGIGRALALELAASQVSLVLNARRADRLDALATEVHRVGGQAIAVAGDVTDPATRVRLIDECHDRFGALDFLINNAGIGAMGPFRDATPERLRRIMEVNFFAPVELTRAALPLLAKSARGMIVNIGSVLGHRAVGLKSEYCASKFALHGWSDALRTELAGQGIDVLLVSPSTTDSEFFDAAIDDATGIRWKERGAVPPAYVARKVLAAMRRGDHEIILTASGKAIVWLDRLAPTLANRMLARVLLRLKRRD